MGRSRKVYHITSIPTHQLLKLDSHISFSFVSFLLLVLVHTRNCKVTSKTTMPRASEEVSQRHPLPFHERNINGTLMREKRSKKAIKITRIMVLAPAPSSIPPYHTSR